MISGLLICILLAFLFIKPAFKYLSGYLSKSEEVNANILLVEGWVSDAVLKIAYNEFKNNDYEYIVTTGLKIRDSYFEMSENGYLVFYPGDQFTGISGNGPHSIEADVYSKLDGENRAHFNLYVNDSLIADAFASKHKTRVKFEYSGYLAGIDSITVQFTNDAVGYFGDRNLYVKEIIIDQKTSIPYMNSEYDAGKLDGRRRTYNNYDSNAQRARNLLISMGMDSLKVIATSGEKVKINRTLTSALAFHDWESSADINIRGINILTIGTHARRTWMTYNKILHEKYKIGIISVPSGYLSRESRIKKTLRETLGILYYWFILIPY
jgi:hypothetical protein